MRNNAHMRVSSRLTGNTPLMLRAHGFTLVELMITVSIFAILATVAVPSFNSMMETQRAKSVTTDIYLALAKTRSEAVKRNKNITLSPKSSSWNNGWQVLDGTSVLEDHNALSGVTVTGPASVVFRASGRVSGSASSFDIVSTGSAAVARCVTIDSSGRPYTETSAC